MKENFKNIIKKGKWLSNTVLTILIIAVIIATCVAINAVVENQDISDIDLTKEKLYSLSRESKDKIKSITQDTNIVIYGMDEYTQIFDYANLYNKENPHIKYEKLEDATTRPDLQLKYAIGSTASNLIIVECGDRKKAVTLSDLYTYDYSTYEQLNTTEQALTNAILSVNLEKTPKIYIVTNHAEYAEQYQVAQEYLKNEGNEIESLDLLVKGEIPSDCSVLILTNPKEDFTDFEKDLVVNYINNGGNIMALVEPNTKKVNLTNFQSILDIYGVSISDEVIYESNSSRMISGYANIIIPEVSYSSSITEYIASDGAVAFMNSGKINFKSSEELESLGVVKEDIVTTTTSSFLRSDVTKPSSTRIDSDQDASGKALATILTKTIKDQDGNSKDSKLVLFASSIFASDLTITLNGTSSNSSTRVMGISFYNNKDLLINSVSYLTQRTDNLTIRKDTGVVTYTATEKEDLIIRVIITVLPIAIILTGIIVWQIRRRKK